MAVTKCHYHGRTYTLPYQTTISLHSNAYEAYSIISNNSPVLLKEYDAIIRDQVKQGVVEVVTEPTPTDGRVVHYLPHHTVMPLHGSQI